MLGLMVTMCGERRCGSKGRRLNNTNCMGQPWQPVRNEQE
jgi:hypothetical protein